MPLAVLEAKFTGKRDEHATTVIEHLTCEVSPWQTPTAHRRHCVPSKKTIPLSLGRNVHVINRLNN